MREGKRVPPPPGLPTEIASVRGGAFVSIHKRGALRGCIGTYQPTEESLAREIIANAIRAATEDPRFPPVATHELAEISVSVDVLSPPEPCTAADLDPRRYGVIVQAGWRRGLLLPDLPGVATVEEQLRVAMLKAGISPGEPTELRRFTVDRHTE